LVVNGLDLGVEMHSGGCSLSLLGARVTLFIPYFEECVPDGCGEFCKYVLSGAWSDFLTVVYPLCCPLAIEDLMPPNRGLSLNERSVFWE
jgi:hypothetical protein